jgi:MFS family permease
MKKFIWPLFYLVIFSFLLFNSFSYLDPDFGWHLRFGEIIWQTKDVPHDQIFMWTLEGKDWVDHEWLANLLIYGLWNLGGYFLITIIFATLPLLTIFLINRYLFKHHLSTISSRVSLAVIELFILLAVSPHLGIRVQEITLLGTTLLFLVFSFYQKNRLTTPPWWLPIFFYIWTCLHAGSLIGLAFFFIWLCAEVLIFYYPKVSGFFNTSPLSKKLLFSWLVIGAISFLGTLLTPYGITLYNFLFEYRDTFYQSHIREWLSPFRFPFKYKQIIFIILVIVTSIGSFTNFEKKLPLFNYLIIGFLTLLATNSIRHFPLLMVAWLIFVLPQSLPALTSKIKTTTLSPFLPFTFFSLLTISAFIIISTKFTTTPFSSYCNRYPCQAVEFLKENYSPEQRLLNSYNYGGYLIGVAPEIKLFIDGRLPQYPYNNYSILEEYYQFTKPNFSRQKLDEHSISIVFQEKLKQPHKLNWFEKYFLGVDALTQDSGYLSFLYHLASSSNWKLIYEDSVSLIYVRK